jgi:hypothetical protein
MNVHDQGAPSYFEVKNKLDEQIPSILPAELRQGEHRIHLESKNN